MGKIQRPQTKKEELVNGILHLGGAIFCLAAMPVALYRAAANPGLVWPVVIFGVGMLMVFTFSTLYHFVSAPKAKRVLKKFDHISIYFLIAGTYTPIVMKYLPVRQAAVFLGIMWAIVLLGTFYKILFITGVRWFSTLLYLGLGWMAVWIINPLLANAPAHVLWLILAGGLSYTLGVVFYINSRKPFFHAVWHVFVLGGAVLHYLSVYQTII